MRWAMNRSFFRWFCVGGLAATGAAVAAYFTHPKQGAQRRAMLRKRVERLWARASNEVQKSLVDTQHHLSGLSARFRASIQSDAPSGQVLEARVRSRLGHVLSRPRKVHVLCDHGLVTLWGTVPQDEICNLLRAVRAVPGVKEVQEHLEPCPLEQFENGHQDALELARREGRLNWSPSRRMLVGA